MNIVGITAKSNTEKLISPPLDLKIKFSVIIIENNNFKEITKLVPLIFKLKNDTIKKVIDVEDFIFENHARKRS